MLSVSPLLCDCPKYLYSKRSLGFQSCIFSYRIVFLDQGNFPNFLATNRLPKMGRLHPRSQSSPLRGIVLATFLLTVFGRMYVYHPARATILEQQSEGPAKLSMQPEVLFVSLCVEGKPEGKKEEVVLNFFREANRQK